MGSRGDRDSQGSRDEPLVPYPSRDGARAPRVTFSFGFGPHTWIVTIIGQAGVRQLSAAGMDPRRLTEPARYRPWTDTRIPLWEFSG